MPDLPTTQWVAAVPSDSIDLDAYTTKKLLTSRLYVGATGDVACVDQSNTATVFPGVPAGTFLDVAVRRVNASGTSASGLVACYWI
jgi:hypothetical protein